MIRKWWIFRDGSTTFRMSLLILIWDSVSWNVRITPSEFIDIQFNLNLRMILYMCWFTILPSPYY